MKQECTHLAPKHRSTEDTHTHRAGGASRKHARMELQLFTGGELQGSEAAGSDTGPHSRVTTGRQSGSQGAGQLGPPNSLLAKYPLAKAE